MPTDYREIGNEILKRLDPDRTRLGEALSTWNDKIGRCLRRKAWSEIPTHCESAHELCNLMQNSDEWSNVIDIAHAEGIFHAYKGISHLYKAAEAKEKRTSSSKKEENEELDKAIDCLEKSRERFHGEYRDQWNEAVLWLNLGRIHRSQNRFNEALAAFQWSCTFSNFNMLSIEKRQEIEKVALEEIKETRGLLGLEPEDSGCQEDRTAQQYREKRSDESAIVKEPSAPLRVLPVIDEKIAAGKEEFASDDIIGYMRQTDEFEFEFEGQALKAELLGRSQLTFLPEYDYVAMLVSGDSMDQAGIVPNDYVILRRSKPDSSGHIVAVAFRDEADSRATLKRIHFESDRVMLEPESSNLEHKTRVLRPEVFAGDNPSVEVVGIAIAVLKP